MTDKPILFSGPMVRALLEGRKTQTRRVVNPQPKWTDEAWHWQSPRYDNGLGADYFHTPHVAGIMSAWVKAMPYATGDRLWVRERFAISGIGWGKKPKDAIGGKAHYGADPDHGWQDYWGNWRPSIHMPRWASRLTLVVTDVRVQRVQEISSDDARAEGVIRTGEFYWTSGEGMGAPTARAAFCKLWDSLNAERGFGWDTNPWVAAYTFTVHKCNIDQIGIAA